MFIKVVNKIKTSALNDRLFRKFCQDKGKCLRRLYDLYDTVVEFLKGTDDNLSIEFSDRHVNLAYLSDTFDKLNQV